MLHVDFALLFWVKQHVDLLSPTLINLFSFYILQSDKQRLIRVVCQLQCFCHHFSRCLCQLIYLILQPVAFIYNSDIFLDAKIRHFGVYAAV